MDFASIIRHDLEQLGMDVKLQPVEFNTLVSKLTSTFEWEAIVLGLTGGIEPHFGKNVWTSNGQLHMWNPRQEKPATDWEKRIDELFTLGVQELNEDKRKVIYDEYQQIASEELPVIYTVLSARLASVRNKFGNLKPSNYGGVLHNIEEIYIKPEHR
jgi:peptide/nickel transport system substrate-binding protein